MDEFLVPFIFAVFIAGGFLGAVWLDCTYTYQETQLKTEAFTHAVDKAFDYLEKR